MLSAALRAQSTPPDQAAPTPQAVPAAQQPAPAPAPPIPEGAAIAPRPIAIVPLDPKIPGFASEVTGGLQVFNGRAFIASSGAVTSGEQTTQVTLPYRGTLRVCASTTVKLAADSSVPAGEIPGLMMVMDHGALEASFATGRNSDILLTPDFRILIGGPSAAEVKVRLGPNGDTCVDNAGVNAPYVLVTSVFDGSDYRVQPGQRVMFQHGSLHEVVDQEKEPCGCPPAATVSGPEAKPGEPVQTTETLVYSAADHAPKPAEAAPAAAALVPTATPPPQKKPGLFTRVGRFFKRIFGAE